MTENEFLLNDRIEKIKSINKLYNLEENSYISFSGGRDSTILHYLLDMALPQNQIQRVYINTGIEYKKITEYVKELQKKDNRIIIVDAKINIKNMLENVGYPFKSKEFSEKLSVYQNSGKTKTVKNYLGETDYHTNGRFMCPQKLKVCFTDNFNLKVSKRCCNELKKKPAGKWARENKKNIVITGMRTAEGGARNQLNCTIFKDNQLKKFHPLAPLNDNFEKWFIETNNIKLCDLYYPPYNFERTGCKGCPYAPELQEELEKMKILLPNEFKQCYLIWGEVYTKYKELNYRLIKTDEENGQQVLNF